MAKRKIQTDAETEATETPDMQLSSDNVTVSVGLTDIPENIKEILAIFPEHPELLVTPQGGVYTPGCKLAVTKTAILYKNPYFKN